MASTCWGSKLQLQAKQRRFQMTRSTLFDRLNQELEAFGKKAQAALDEIARKQPK